MATIFFFLSGLWGTVPGLLFFRKFSFFFLSFCWMILRIFCAWNTGTINNAHVQATTL